MLKIFNYNSYYKWKIFTPQPLRSSLTEPLRSSLPQFVDTTPSEFLRNSLGVPSEFVDTTLTNRRFVRHNSDKPSVCTTEPLRSSLGVPSEFLQGSSARLSSALNFVKTKAPIRCKGKKECTLYTSKQKTSGSLLPHTLQYSPQPLWSLSHKADKSKICTIWNSWPSKEGLTTRRDQKLTKERTGKRSKNGTKTGLQNNVQSQTLNPSKLTLLQNSAASKWKLNRKACLERTCFAGAGNNIFQSTLGNIEIQTATRLARIMVNYWNFYSLNRISLYSLFKKHTTAHQSNALHGKASINSINNLANFSNSLGIPHAVAGENPQYLSEYEKYLPLRGVLDKSYKSKIRTICTIYNSWERKATLTNQRFVHHNSYKSKICTTHNKSSIWTSNVRVWGIKLKVKEKTPQGNIIYKVAKRWNNFYFAIAQSKNSLKICENKNSSYNLQRLSMENSGNSSQLNNNNFQLIDLLQFSQLQRDRFYPNWYRLYLPDMEATEFLKNVANYYFSLGLQTLTFPSTKSSYCFNPALGKLKVSTASPFLTFLSKNTQEEKYKLLIPNSFSYAYCPPSILINSTSASNSRDKLTSVIEDELQRNFKGTPKELRRGSVVQTEGLSKLCRTNRRFVRVVSTVQINDLVDKSSICSARDIKNPSFIKVAKDQLDPLNVPFSLLLESQIFPLNYNGFSTVEKELLYNVLVNSSFAQAFYLINQNRQLLDFFVDYLLRFQILRQHQILYLFSTLLLGCNKTA